MIPFKRGVNPLTTNEETTLGQWWDEEYTKSKSTKNWSWKGKEKAIKDALLLCNNDHCAYCDCHPLLDDKGFEIDHFKPKAKFRLEAFTYSNLFPCCRECNKRMNNYHPLLLKPDEVNYQFKEYFRYDIFTGQILVNESKPIGNQERAEITLRLFKLNIGNKPKNRRKAIQKEIRINSPINERPYRYGYL